MDIFVIDILKKNKVDAILTDVQMPEMTGVELCRSIKQTPGFELLPVMLITSHESTPQLRIEGYESGADDFIKRPIDNKELVVRIDAMFKLRTAEKALEDYINKLEEKSNELKRVVQLMTGREVRMAELKKRISQLEEQLQENGIEPL